VSYLGIDLGTSGLRALLVDDAGRPIGASEHHYAVSNPHPGWSEQNPADWIAALDAAIEELREKCQEFQTLAGIGVAGHMHGATLLDETGDVLRPCILWNDTRSHVEAAELDAVDGVRDLSGNIVFPGFTAPKLTWVKNHEPEIFAKIAKVLLPAAYLNYYLTGAYVADMSDSAGTSWLDVAERNWSAPLLDAGQMSMGQMPSLVEGSQKAGSLRSDLRRAWGLKGDVVVAGGAGDNAAAACGIGALNQGQAFVSLGTSGVLLAARDGYHPAPATAVHTFCHAVPDRWYQMGVMLSATDNLNWLARISGTNPADLTKSLGDTPRAPGRVRFLPYLSGERTPHNDADIRGAFTGLGTETDRDDLTRAVLEGVTFGLRESYDALAATGAQMDQLFAIGGGAASRYWLDLIATVFDTPLCLPAGSEFGAALGAARLGLAAASGDDVEDIMTPPEIEEVVEPDPALRDAFEAAYMQYKQAYPAIKSVQ